MGSEWKVRSKRRCSGVKFQCKSRYPGSAMDKVQKTDEEWRKQLTREQYHVARQKGTEPAFTGKYWDNHEPGLYRCACCGEELFQSDTKFESGTGWPSFYAPVDAS